MKEQATSEEKLLPPKILRKPVVIPSCWKNACRNFSIIPSEIIVFEKKIGPITVGALGAQHAPHSFNVKHSPIN